MCEPWRGDHPTPFTFEVPLTSLISPFTPEGSPNFEGPALALFLPQRPIQTVQEPPTQTYLPFPQPNAPPLTVEPANLVK